MGLNVSRQELDELVRSGRIRAEDITERTVNVENLMTKQKAQYCAFPKKRRKKAEFVIACHMPPGVWLVPIETHSIINDERSRKQAMGWKASQKRAVYFTLGKNHGSLFAFADLGIHSGKKIKVSMTRLHPGGLDDDNVVMSMKYVRDAIADLLGTDDRNKLISWIANEEKSKLIGVRITIAREDLPL